MGAILDYVTARKKQLAEAKERIRFYEQAQHWRFKAVFIDPPTADDVRLRELEKTVASLSVCMARYFSALKTLSPKPVTQTLVTPRQQPRKGLEL